MQDILIRNATLVNEGTYTESDLLIQQGRIAKIAPFITPPHNSYELDAQGGWLIPGMIDDQVHFRDPGAPHKGSIATESSAAVVGGITSYMDMPNTTPPTLTLEALNAKKAIAAQHSIANYGFHFGVSNQNLDIVETLDPRLVSGIKVFMGASTGNMLVDDPKILERLFSNAPTILLAHCESTPRIKANEELYQHTFGNAIPAHCHPEIRDVEACFESSQLAVSLAKKYQTRLHVLHLTTAKELLLFEDKPLSQKHITAEVCVHHLTFDDRDYDRLNHLIKCNPAIKNRTDKESLINAVAASNYIDVIGTDHAPHTWEEKQQDYMQAPSGLPLVQHAIPALMELVAKDRLSLHQLVQKTSHNVAELFNIQERGYIREGYWADLVLLQKNLWAIPVAQQPHYMHCAWTPFQQSTFKYLVDTTIVSGQLAWHKEHLYHTCRGQALQFSH